MNQPIDSDDLIGRAAALLMKQVRADERARCAQKVRDFDWSRLPNHPFIGDHATVKQLLDSIAKEIGTPDA